MARSWFYLVSEEGMTRTDNEMVVQALEKIGFRRCGYRVYPRKRHDMKSESEVQLSAKR